MLDRAPQARRARALATAALLGAVLGGCHGAESPATAPGAPPGAQPGPDPASPAPAVKPMRFRPDETHLAEDEVVLPTAQGGRGASALVVVSVDGQAPVTFLLDTGFGVCALDEGYAATLPGKVVKLHGRATVVGSSAAEVSVQRAKRLSSLACGGLELRGIDAFVLDLRAFSAGLGVDMVGILGFPAFHDCLLELDYLEHEVRVSTRRLGEPDGESLLPFTLDEGTPALTARLGERTISFDLDSGSNESIGLPEGLEGLDWAYGPVPFSKVISVSGEHGRVSFGRLAGDLRLGRYVLQRPIVNLSAGGGRFGTDLLARFAWSFDQRSGTVALEREGTSLDFPPWRGTGAAFLRQGDHEIVVDVVPSSPADAAGLREGDVVLKRQDHPFRSELQGVLPSGFEGEFLLVKKGDEERVVALQTVDLIP